MADAHLRIAVVAALSFVGCGAPPPPPVKPPPPAPAPTPAGLDFEGAKTGAFRSKRFQISLPLPDGHAWRIDDHKDRWLVATHPPTGSELIVRVWAEDGRANTKTCEEAARVWKKLPDREGAEVVSSVNVAAPSGFDTHADLLVRAPTKTGAPISANILAFGGHLHRCFAFVFTTVASGPDAERTVGARLAAMLQRSLRDVSAVDELNPNVRVEPVLEH
jgi:hypothetical protein